MNKTFTMNKTFFEKIISIILLFDVIVHWSIMNKIFWISSKISNMKISDEKISSYLSANKGLFAQKCWQNLLTSSSNSLDADRATRLLDLKKFQYKNSSSYSSIILTLLSSLMTEIKIKIIRINNSRSIWKLTVDVERTVVNSKKTRYMAKVSRAREFICMIICCSLKINDRMNVWTINFYL
jgi:hypothetical protein